MGTEICSDRLDGDHGRTVAARADAKPVDASIESTQKGRSTTRAAVGVIIASTMNGRAVPAAPPASSASVRRVMQGNARAETGPERELRSALHRRGLRFRKNHSPVVGVRCRVDVAFTAARVAVFLDGCFWHSCPEHGTLPRTNADWWRVKLAANKDRDLRNDVALTTAGWTVLRLWEHEPVEEMVERVVAVLGSSYAASSSVSVH